jgi:hypothetical protein
VTEALESVGKHYLLDNTRIRSVLRIEFRDLDQTMVDMGHSAIKFGFVPVTTQYVRVHPEAQSSP